MSYIATTTLNAKGGLIRKGQSVPPSFPRLKEFIKRGWIKELSVAKVETPIPIIETTKENPDSIVEIIPEEPETATEPETEPVIFDSAEFKEAIINAELSKIRLDGLHYLTPAKLNALTEEGYHTLLDIKECAKDIDELTTINGVGYLTAAKLIKEIKDISQLQELTESE